jgi:hypothetical protein
MRSAAQQGHGHGKGITAFVATILAVAATAGCGATHSPSTVQLALTAPTDGSALAASNIKVFGAVRPPSAAVLVAGKQAHVSHGVFGRWMTLHKGLSHIEIVATAVGYAPAKLEVAVRSSPRSLPTHTSSEAGSVSTVPPAPGHRYDPRIRANVLRFCEAGAGGMGAAKASCQCALSHLESRVSQDMLLAMERAFLNGEAKLPRWFRDIALSCRET